MATERRCMICGRVFSDLSAEPHACDPGMVALADRADPMRARAELAERCLAVENELKQSAKRQRDALGAECARLRRLAGDLMRARDAERAALRKILAALPHCYTCPWHVLSPGTHYCDDIVEYFCDEHAKVVRETAKSVAEVPAAPDIRSALAALGDRARK